MYVLSKMTTSELAILKEFAESKHKEISTDKVADDFLNKDRSTPDNTAEKQIADIDRERKIQNFLGR